MRSPERALSNTDLVGRLSVSVVRGLGGNTDEMLGVL